MASSSSRCGKRPTPIVGKENPDKWFSDEEKCKVFFCFWGLKEVIRHKCLSIQFFRNEGFIFQEWLIYSGLSKFVELEGDYYPNLVKVFYANIWAEGNLIRSRVKGVDIHIDEVVWKTVVGFHTGGMKYHQGIQGVYKVLTR
ncbi:hypothetical protein LR48_Vigan257s001400 [Vigna angularis]|uniref:Uncharacterized protein n=1 Tax=Phaseolus angularis TaxID=3914 RepID=A0A0L9T723_PHAAN|nr:hypothetical protein LR48_Vigan257s001400 [Vigna angularis]